MNEDEISRLDTANADLDSDMGFLLEVDLTYPPSLQNETEDLPLAPETFVVEEEMMTDHMKEQWEAQCQQRFGKSRSYRGCKKLMLTHYDRVKYIVHGKLLQFYLRMGMQLTRVHRAIAFTQSDFFAPYIAYNSQRRQDAKSAFEKDYYKLKN